MKIKLILWISELFIRITKYIFSHVYSRPVEVSQFVMLLEGIVKLFYNLRMCLYVPILSCHVVNKCMCQVDVLTVRYILFLLQINFLKKIDDPRFVYFHHKNTMQHIQEKWLNSIDYFLKSNNGTGTLKKQIHAGIRDRACVQSLLVPHLAERLQ